MATFLEIQTKVKTRLIDTPAAVLAEVPGMVNTVLHDAQVKHNFKVMETLGGPYTTSISPNRVLTTIPSDFKEARGDPYRVYFTTGRSIPVPWAANRNAVQGFYYPTAVGPPAFLVHAEPGNTGVANVEVWPLSDTNSDYANGEYRIYIPYWRFLPPLSADGDTNWFTVRCEMYLVHMACALGFEVDWDEERMSVQKQLAKEQWDQILLEDKRMRLAQTNTLVIHRQGANSPALRR